MVACLDLSTTNQRSDIVMYVSRNASWRATYGQCNEISASWDKARTHRWTRYTEISFGLRIGLFTQRTPGPQILIFNREKIANPHL